MTNDPQWVEDLREDAHRLVKNAAEIALDRGYRGESAARYAVDVFKTVDVLITEGAK